MGKPNGNVFLAGDPLWYKSAVIYEVPVRAFADSNADGIGDFRGLTQRLDYLQDLGVTALWLLPFYPSPLKDDGYDISDYYSINPIYGTLGDFKAFMREAHGRGLRVITELVLNHTSDQHQWFQRSRRAKPGSRDREFYVWSDSPEKYKGTRIIFKDFELSNWTWDPVAGAYYWHRFYSHQPDLNYDSPHVHKELKKVFDFWLDMGVDGLRLDAVPYLYEREGTSCENLRETHQFLKELRRHVDEKYHDRMLLAEANQWPEEAVSYFGSGRGDECHMAFHFPLMPRLFMAIRMEDRVPIIDILDQTPPIPETSQWALFLRNHDELTLEMVTDEERDYMYRVYASNSKARINLGIRRRLAPLLNNDRKRIELLNILLLSFPGTPVIYYGDEIGMGDNIFLGDRNGVRTPMQWSADKNAGFSRATPQALYLPIILEPEYHYEAINVDTQQRNPHALLWWTKRLLALRKRWKVFGLGTLEFLHPENRKVLAFVRRHEGQVVLVVANLSRFPQPVELDLAAHQGRVPVEMFGRTRFPVIGPSRYAFTLSPHAAFWFSLELPAGHEPADVSKRICDTMTVSADWEQVLEPAMRPAFEACLPEWLRAQAWFAGKAELKSARIRDVVPVPLNSGRLQLVFLTLEFVQREPEEYLMPLAFADGEEAAAVERERARSVLAHLRIEGTGASGLLHEAADNRHFLEVLFENVVRRRTSKGMEGELSVSSTSRLRALKHDEDRPAARINTTDRNVSAIFGDRFILKLYRKLDSGANPEIESARFLDAREFPHVPQFGGVLEYERAGSERIGLAMISQFIPNTTNGWHFTLDALRRYFDRVRTFPADARPEDLHAASVLDLAHAEIPERVAGTLGTFLEAARLLGQRTAELHLALASDPENKDFAPEPFTPFYQRSLFQSFRNQLLHNLQLLRRQAKGLPQRDQSLAEQVLGWQDAMLARFKAIHETPLSAMRIRCHGDFHLEQVLHTGKDFVIIDFEGEPSRPMSERRIKRSPLRDVAGMMRSFSYAAYVALLQQLESGMLHAEQFRAAEPWARFWDRWIGAAFLRRYLHTLHGSNLLPATRDGLSVLLNAFLLDKAVTEMGYELTDRIHRAHVPLRGILQLMDPNRPQ